MKKLFIGIVLFTKILTSTAFVQAEPLNIDAKAYILIDSKTGLVISEQNSDQKLYPASTTKIMTAILGIENADPEQIMTVSQYAIDNIGPGGMHVGLLNGEQLKFKDLLNALLISSANETSYVIAENIGPTPEEFFKRMNERARELGATNTNFVNPCGMDTDEAGKNHLTTAHDLSLMAKYAMTLPLFRETVKKTSYTLPSTNMHSEAYTLNSTNKLLLLDEYRSKYYSEVTGIKTGFTSRAAFNLVASAKNEDGMELISVIMGCPTNAGVFQESKKLLEYGFKNYSLQTVVAPNSYIDSTSVADASFNPNLDILTEEGLECALPNDPEVWNDITKDVQINNEISAPVKKDTVLGSVEYKLKGTSLGKVNLIASRDVEKLVIPPTPLKTAMSDFNSSIYSKVLGTLFAALVAFLGLRLILRKISRYRRQRRT